MLGRGDLRARRWWVGAALLAMLPACGPPAKPVVTPTSKPASRPAATSRPASAPTTWVLQLKLADGTPLANRALKLVCGADLADWRTVEARTDALGRLRLRRESCRLTFLSRHRRWLTPAQPVLVLPADLRVMVDVTMPIRATLTLDSRVDSSHPLRRSGLQLTLREGMLRADGKPLVRATVGARVGPTSRDVKSMYLKARQATLQLFWDTFWRRFGSKRVKRKALLDAIVTGDKAIAAGRHAKAKASWARALKLTDNLPVKNPLRAYVIAREMSRLVGEFLRKECFPSRRLPLRALARFEKRLGKQAVSLKSGASALFKARNIWISLAMKTEFASIYAGFAYALERGYRNTPVPRKVTRLGAHAVQIYGKQSVYARRLKVAPLLDEGRKLLREVERALAKLSKAKALTKLLAAQKLAHRALAKRIEGRIALRVRTVQRVGLVPVALRKAPRGADVLTTPLRTRAGLQSLSALLGKRRTLLVIGHCHRKRSWMAALAKLAEDYRHIGLKVGAAAVYGCHSASDERGYWLAGSTLSWALETVGDSVVLLDERGAVLWRQRIRRIDDVGPTAIAWLETNWPAFARAKRRGAPPPKAALARELARLKVAVEVALKRGKTSRALKLARRAAKLAPQRAEVQRQLALAAGHARDLGTVTDRTRWWRQRYGDLAAEVLLDRVRRETGVPKLTDPGRSTPPAAGVAP